MSELEERVRELEAESAVVLGPRLAVVLCELGSALASIGAKARGIEKLREALVLFEAQQDSHGIVDALTRLGVELTEDFPTDARGYLERALALARTTGNRSQEATALHDLAILDDYGDELPSAIARLRESVAILRTLDDMRGELALTLNALAMSLDVDGKSEEANVAWTEALELFGNEVDYPPGLASTLNNIGSSKDHAGDVEGGIEYYLKALAIQDRVGDVYEQIRFLGNLRLAYRQLGRLGESIAALRRILAIQEHIGDAKGVADTLYKLGDSVAREKMTADADELYARSMAAFAALDDEDNVAFVEMERARAWSEAGEHATAISFGTHALGMRYQLGDDEGIGIASHNLAMIHSAAGEHSKAIELYTRSAAISEARGDREGQRLTFTYLAHDYVMTSREVNAIDCYNKALALAEADENRDAIADALDELGGLHASLGDRTPAIAFTRRAIAAYEGNAEAVHRLRKRLADLERSTSN